MKKFIVTAICFFTLIYAHAQDEINLKETFQEAEYYLLYEDYQEALPLYNQLIANGHENAYIHYRLGECYLSIPGQKAKAIAFLETASQNISENIKEGSFKETNAPVRTLFFLGMAYQVNNELDKAIDAFTRFKDLLEVDDIYNLDYVEQEIQSCYHAKELMSNPVRFKQSNVGENINDGFSNFRPVVSADQKSMVYVSRLKFYDGIFYSEKKDGKWLAPVNIASDLKSDGNIYPCYLSPDGTTLLLFKEDNYGGDIYVSYFKEGKWQLPSKLNSNINSRYWETHASLTTDKKTLYFVSNRKDSYGGLDIYKSVFNDEIGEWGEAVNLGPEINTPFNEEAPCISEDGKTLYFSSQGHYNMGGYDVFYSTKMDTSWSTPVNIGYPINTTDDDLFFYPIQNGTQAYISRYDKTGFGQEDIIRLEFYTDENPFLVNVKGTVTLKDKQKDFLKNDFQVDILDSSKVEVIRTIYLDDNSGEFATKLETGTYKFIFKSKEYKQAIKTVHIPENYMREEFLFNVELTPLKVTTGEYLTIKNIYFGFDDYSLTNESKTELERIKNIMVKYPSLKIEIIGHTDAKGSAAYNKKLSLKRADAAIKYLSDKGIAPERFVAKGVGMEQPIAVNTNNDGTDNPEGRKFNRRIEIKIQETDKKVIITEDVDIPAHLRLNNLKYCIFLSKEEKELPKDFFDQYDPIKDQKINIYKSGNSFIYTLGDCNKKSDLIKVFNTVLDLGFKDAEIMSSYDIEKLIK